MIIEKEKIMKSINKIFLFCSIIFIGCINDNQFTTTYLNPIIEKTISHAVFSTDKKINSLGILSNGNIIIKFSENIDVEKMIYKYYYSLIMNGTIINTFNLENEKYIPYIYDNKPPFLLTNDDRIVISVPLPSWKRGEFVPAIFNLETNELEEIYKKSWFIVGNQNKSPNSELVSITFDPRNSRFNSKPFKFIIHQLKNDGKYNINPREIKMLREDINRLIDVYPGNKGNEVMLLYNNEETAVIEVYDYKKQIIINRYILSKKVSERGGTNPLSICDYSFP